jgi:hypothetical protein
MKIVILGYEISIRKREQKKTRTKENPLTQEILQIFSDSNILKLSVPAIHRQLEKKGVKVTNEFAIMRAVGELEDQQKLFLFSFDRIYREDGGAIYLAEYSKSKPT